MGGRTLYGYMVSYSVNAKNRYGAYTGAQQRFLLIRNGQVIKEWEPENSSSHAKRSFVNTRRGHSCTLPGAACSNNPT